MTKRRYKVLSVILFLAILAMLVWLLLYGEKGQENIQIIKDIFNGKVERDNIQDRLHDLGVRGYLIIVVLSMLQVLMMVVPAEPIQVLSGLSFGVWSGLLCCMCGVVIGIALIYILQKFFGKKLEIYFDQKLDIDIREYGNSKILTLVVLILYLLPAVPYGVICFICATTKMKFHRYMIVNTIGAIPSELIGVALGHMTLNSNWILSVAVVVLIVIALIVVMSKREYLVAKINAYIKHRADMHNGKFGVRSYSRHRLTIPYLISRICLFGKVKCIYKNNVGEIEHPSIVLCNHGAFIDFVYAGTILKKHSPNFIVARLYFYKTLLARVLSAVGCFPKSMFALDIESAKNCVKVLKNNGVLAMMPEARLSTAGKFEDIQPQTYAFLKKCGVPVYSIKLEGDYFAKPKWADKIRRGSVVYATLDTLLTKEDIETLSAEEIAGRVEERLYYNEYDWLASHPEITYKSKTLAVGLENILTLCPVCKKRYTLGTKGKEIFCSCGMRATLDDRYAFVGGKPFGNILEWYEYQFDEYRKEIRENPDFSISSHVTLHHSSKDGKKLLRQAGDGVCRLSREGLSYKGTEDGEVIEKTFPSENMYMLLFGAGEDFEIYEGKTIWYFRPDVLSSSVDWYIVSKILKESGGSL